MSFPTNILALMDAGDQYLSNLNQQLLSEMKRGCMDCRPNGMDRLQTTMLALNLKNNLPNSVYDAIDAENIEIMLYIIGDYVVQVPPTVIAGAPQVVSIDSSPAVFTAVITQGSAPITSILWEQTSGNPATLSGANTATLSVSNYVVGVIGLKVTVTDSNGLSASSTTQLTGSNATAKTAYFSTGSDFTIPSYQTIIDTWTPVTFQPNGAIDFPFNVTELSILKVAYPQSEPIKNRWIDINDVLLFGAIGTEEDLWGVSTNVGGAVALRVVTTNYLTSYSKPTPSGIRFLTI